MSNLEKLQESPQETGEKFVHLVTFKNTYIDNEEICETYQSEKS